MGRGRARQTAAPGARRSPHDGAPRSELSERSRPDAAARGVEVDYVVVRYTSGLVELTAKIVPTSIRTSCLPFRTSARTRGRRRDRRNSEAARRRRAAPEMFRRGSPRIPWRVPARSFHPTPPGIGRSGATVEAAGALPLAAGALPYRFRRPLRRPQRSDSHGLPNEPSPRSSALGPGARGVCAFVTKASRAGFRKLRRFLSKRRMQGRYDKNAKPPGVLGELNLERGSGPTPSKPRRPRSRSRGRPQRHLKEKSPDRRRTGAWRHQTVPREGVREIAV